MFLHVSILRSSSGSVDCSLLKLYVKMLITLLYLSVMRHHIVRTCICCIARAERDGTRAETRFRLSPKLTSPFKSVGASVQSTTGSRGVRISLSNAG